MSSLLCNSVSISAASESTRLNLNDSCFHEEESDSYGLVHLRGSIMFGGLQLTAGVENVLDEDYEDHLNGINRVSGSDVAVGDRLPGDGRNYFLTLEYLLD